MFHLKWKPSPPLETGAETPGKAVDSLRDRRLAGAARADLRVDLAQQLDRLEVLAAAVDVGHPFAGLAGIVEVEHGGDGIDAQPVHVVPLQPVERVGGQEVRDLPPAEIVDQRVPVLVEPEARVGVLVERGSVELHQPVRVGREMGGHPVEDDAEPGLVRRLDQAAERVRIAEARGGGEQPDRLVAPGAGERVFRDRHELQMREAHVDRVGDQLVGQLVVGEEATGRIVRLALPFRAHPGAQMHLVDRGGGVDVEGGAGCGVLGPLRRALHERGLSGAALGAEGDRIGLGGKGMAVRAHDLELVGRALADSGHEQLPAAGLVALAHDVAPPVPQVPFADHRDAPRVRRPHGEGRALRAIEHRRMRAELVVELQMAPLGDQPQVHVAQPRAEAVGIAPAPGIAAALEGERVGKGLALGRPDEEPALVDALERHRRLALGVARHGRLRARLEGRDAQRAFVRMGAEPAERIVHAARHDGVDHLLWQRPIGIHPGNRAGVHRGQAHEWLPSSDRRMSSTPRTGIPIQPGRLPAS